jgi:iron-sulfur cluster insertion protein
MIQEKDQKEFKVTQAAQEALSFDLRIGIKGGSCNGYAYHFERVEDSQSISRDDRVIPLGEYSIVVDKKSYRFLRGATLDYTKSLMYSGFKIANPSAVSECGCGMSFSM